MEVKKEELTEDKEIEGGEGRERERDLGENCHLD